MTKAIRRFGWSVTGAGLLLACSCASGPGIKTLSNPVARISGEIWEITGKRYSGTTSAVLREFDLSSTVQHDPDAAIRKLDALLKENERADIRFAAAEIALNEAIRLGNSGSPTEFGYLLCAIHNSEAALGTSEPGLQPKLVELYNQANAELAWLLHPHAKGGQQVLAKGPLRSGTVSWKRGRHEVVDPGFYDTLTPTSRIEVRGFDERNIDNGIGGSLVGYAKGTPERKKKDPFMPGTGYGISLAATVDWDGPNRARVVLHDPFREERIRLHGKSYPLSADPTAAVATAMNATPGDATGWLGMLRPNKEDASMGLYSLEPYSDDRIPLILVHGLMSTPGTWRELINACYADPVIRRNYQLLTFFYPTGYSVPHNALSLREQLRKYRKLHDPRGKNPKMRKMVMVGHSMGCLLTNFQIRDGGDPLWYAFFKDSPDKVIEDPALRDLLRREVYFKANPDIARVAFVCGPHRGSPLADDWLGRFGAYLIHLPFQTLDTMSGGNLGAFTTVLGQSVISESPSSINNLKANSPVLEAILARPIPHHPAIHSIIGDRGKGSGPGSSDGVVPYWSSHLDRVKSEVFIPASHTEATNHPDNVRELKRILREHVGAAAPKSQHPATR